jgi:hypothetical protein
MLLTYSVRSRSHRLSKPKREPLQGSLARCTLVATLVFIGILCFEKTNSVAADNTNHYRQWAFIQLNNLDEFYCLDYLYFRESRWNPNARNGSHYGIPQGRSKWLATVDGYKQVEWGIKYNNNRYGSMCKALEHYKLKGWH